jgi:hypothetical protein
MAVFDPVPGRHPRLAAWAQGFIRAGWTLRAVAALFNVEPVELTDAGVRP